MACLCPDGRRIAVFFSVTRFSFPQWKTAAIDGSLSSEALLFFSWYFSALFSGNSQAIQAGLSFCLKGIKRTFPSRQTLGMHLTGMWSSAPLLCFLGSRLCDAWSEILLRGLRLSEGAIVKTENLIHNFPVCESCMYGSIPPPHPLFPWRDSSFVGILRLLALECFR